jgi:hypothetical protein
MRVALIALMVVAAGPAFAACPAPAKPDAWSTISGTRAPGKQAPCPPQPGPDRKQAAPAPDGSTFTIGNTTVTVRGHVQVDVTTGSGR